MLVGRQVCCKVVDEHTLREIFDDVRSGALPVEEALRRVRRLPFSDLGFARVDHHRSLRQGIAEVVYGPGKAPRECALIVGDLLAEVEETPVILTRADIDQVEAALDANPGGMAFPLSPLSPLSSPSPVPPLAEGSEEMEGTRRRVRGGGGAGWGAQEGGSVSRWTLAGVSTVVWRKARPRSFGDVAVTVVTAGTADLPVATECVTVLSAHGLDPVLIADCGVAGVHRLVASMDELVRADAVVVVAGMEGALASVVAGLVSVPVVAVPTSVGYGAALEGVTALLAMLSCCVPGVTVVGIDNGFGAACALLRLLAPRRLAQAGNASPAGETGAEAGETAVAAQVRVEDSQAQ